MTDAMVGAMVSAMTTEKGHHVGRTLSQMLGWPDAPWDRVAIAPTPGILATAMPIADLAAAAQGLVGLAAAGVHQARGGPAQDITVDRAEASLSMTAAAYLKVDGAAQAEWDALTGYFPCADGWVYLHCQFPHLKQRMLQVLDLPNDPDAVRAGLLHLSAQEVEDRAADAGACGIRRRSRAEWQAHAHAQHLAKNPVVRLQGHGTALPKPMALGEQPLTGVRVLDLSRVIAGPTIGRVLAEHGAEVMRVSGPHLPSLAPLVIDTGPGKQTCHIDLRDSGDRQAFTALLRTADIMIDGYRPGALEGRGFGAEDVATINPSLIRVDLSAFGADGPWGGRRGYDTYVQAATGLSQDGPDGPTRLPCQPLDYLSGYLGAASAMIALMHRMTQGQGWTIDLALARTAQFVWDWSDALDPEPAPPMANPGIDTVDHWRWTGASAFGEISQLRPARTLSVTPPILRHAAKPLGSDEPVWGSDA